MRYTGLSEDVHKAIISKSTTVLNTPAIVNIWLVATAMENMIVMIIRLDKFLNDPD